MGSNTQPYAQNGITISKSTLYVGDEVTLIYTGLLAQSGAEKIYAHVGYGENWEEKGFIPMINEGGSFRCTFKISLSGFLNVCFKDAADNWDNNSSDNYIFKVSKKARRSTKSTEDKDKDKDAAESTKAAKEEKPAKEAAPRKRATRKKKEE